MYAFNFNRISGHGGGAAAANLNSSTPRSAAVAYLSSNPTFLGSSKYLSSSNTLFSPSSSMLFSHADRIPGLDGSSPATHRSTSKISWPGPPGVDVAVGSATTDHLLASLKRSSSEGEGTHR